MIRSPIYPFLTLNKYPARYSSRVVTLFTVYTNNAKAEITNMSATINMHGYIYIYIYIYIRRIMTCTLCVM